MATTIEFDCPLVRETAYGVVEELGMKHNKMTMNPVIGKFTIEWIVGDEEEVVEIGIWTEGNKVTDYDGVFELPKEALTLLRENGYDTTEVEVQDGNAE